MSTAIDNIATAFTPLTNEQENTILAPTDPWSDDQALKTAVQDFNKAEAYRTQNHDWRWRNADELYLAWVQQKYWEGTKIPRASLSVFTAFTQVESLMPKIMSSIFSDNPWFQCDPRTGTSAEDARKVASLVYDQLEQTQVRENMRRTIKSGFIYGNGITELTWLSQEIDSVKNVPSWRQKMKAMNDPRQGTIKVPTGAYERVLKQVKSSKIENRPELNYRSIKDFFIDPNASSPNPRSGEYCAIRLYKPISFFEALRENEEFNIPSTEELIELAKYKVTAQADSTKSTVELMRYGWWTPQFDQTVDPAGKRIETIAYWRDDRVVWVLGRSKVALNEPNPYGFRPFYGTCYADVPDRFYGQGICDVTEGEQRLQTSVTNGSIDELALRLHAPVQKKRGMVIPSYQLRTRPGQMIDVDEPGKDYIQTQFPPIVQDAYIQIQASNVRAAQITGESDVATIGTPSGGNSANRTAAGINTQADAASSRIRYQIENIEDQYIEPMLQDIGTLNGMFPPIGTPMAQMVAMSKVKFYMRASAKMMSRAALMQNFPLIFQTATNPAFVQQLAQMGQTINFVEFFQMILDMSGFQNRADLIRPLTQQEQQKLNAPPPDVVLRQQMAQERSQGQLQLQGAKSQTQLQIEQMKQQGKFQGEQMKHKSALTQALLGPALNMVLAPDKEKE